MEISGLLHLQLFRELEVNELEEVLSGIVYRVRSFKSGALIFQSGEMVNSLVIVISGMVKGEMTDQGGRIIKIEDIQAPEALAPAFMFGKRNFYPVNVIAVSDTELLYIERKELIKLFMKSERILISFLDMVSNRSQFLSEKIRFLSFKTIRAKLAHYLLQLSGKSGNSIRLDLTQEGLAGFFGVTRPSVARELGRLEDDGYIEARGKNINIIDSKGLADMISI